MVLMVLARQTASIAGLGCRRTTDSRSLLESDPSADLELHAKGDVDHPILVGDLRTDVLERDHHLPGGGQERMVEVRFRAQNVRTLHPNLYMLREVDEHRSVELPVTFRPCGREIVRGDDRQQILRAPV